MAKSVLVVDDSSVARKILLRVLPKEWLVTQAADGAQAIAAFRASKPDLIFLDLNMPVMDGYEVLAALQGERDCPPIVVLSGDIQPKAQERVLALGAVAFVKKPLGTDRIAELLGKCMVP